jgi:hypothetical protein
MLPVPVVRRKRSLFLDFLHDTLLRENSGNQALGACAGGSGCLGG